MSLPKRRVAALVSAALALPLAGAIAVSGGTVAALQDSVNVRASVGVAGTPYALARSVSIGVSYRQAGDGSASVTDNRHQIIDSRTAPSNAPVAAFGTPWSYPNTGFRVNWAQNIVGCTSSSFGGNTNRCPGTVGGSLVSASSGNVPATQKFDIDFWDERTPNTSLQLHDLYTSASCHADGTVSAGSPHVNYNVGGRSWPHTRRTDWQGGPGDNRFVVVQQWGSATWDIANTVEIQTIRQTFSNPRRALSAVVAYATGSDSRDGTKVRSDMVFVTKSECVVTPDGEVISNNDFGELIPAFKRLPTPGWDSNVWGSGATRWGPSGTITDFSHTSRTTTSDSRVAGANIIAEGRLAAAENDESTSAPDIPDDRRPTSESPDVTTSALTPTTTEAESTTTTSAGPDPSTTPTSTPEEPAEFARADGEELSTADTALVEEAIEAAASAKSGEIDGAEYDVVENQLDGTTLIITRADGSTLRIVWEK